MLPPSTASLLAQSGTISRDVSPLFLRVELGNREICKSAWTSVHLDPVPVTETCLFDFREFRVMSPVSRLVLLMKRSEECKFGRNQEEFEFTGQVSPMTTKVGGKFS
ncbi:unnamed protein product [Somion occarium]|uniref:Uncharacterized protein n=1 Tax=Somion occarium TaxID=3059160 RepID=A0ABP1DWT4_9APHY